MRTIWTSSLTAKTTPFALACRYSPKGDLADVRAVALSRKNGA